MQMKISGSHIFNAFLLPKSVTISEEAPATDFSSSSRSERVDSSFRASKQSRDKEHYYHHLASSSSGGSGSLTKKERAQSEKVLLFPPQLAETGAPPKG